MLNTVIPVAKRSKKTPEIDKELLSQYQLLDDDFQEIINHIGLYQDHIDMFLNGMVDESGNSASDDADIEDLPF
jgi:hypothetical protein